MGFSPVGSTPIQKETLGQGNASLHYTTIRMLKFHKKRFHKMDSFERMYNESISDEGTNQEQKKGHLFKAYKDLLEHHEKLVEEENLINKMERKAQIRNTIFRGVTTLVIGFSIMLVYFVAAKWGIHMPLLKLPVQ
ncbi:MULTISPECIES: hypothetical protein [unclassified Pseudoalteromonas]|jgi:Fe2+ transport system protein B|uniref:hypothetical protein n=1 Tax=unclassified Pseudoalteromonas TaxID=194690 RepID=UPI00110B252A|nr:hypothetical protein [Pseudoalteromonas sp. S1688]TMP45734.1 hypothetical protein CWB81_19235 [Pseudoalteromonas sp. S1688]